MNKRGETLLEVLIALTLITVSAAAAASAIVSANRSLSLSKNYLIAQNLASEGLEIVKNIRDTNWMKFPVNKNECWLNLDMEAEQSDECGSIEEGDYSISKNDATDRWTLTIAEADKRIDTIPETTTYGLKLVQADGYYQYEPVSLPGDIPVFHRGIRVLKMDDAGTTEATIQVIVKWYEGAKLYEIKGTEILTNYL